MYSVIAEALAGRCHDVTMLISYPAKIDSGNKQVTQLSSPTYQQLSEEVFMYKPKMMPPFSVWSTVRGVWDKVGMP
jgi:hypothetical protein